MLMILFWWFAIAFLTGLAAKARHRSFIIWFIWGAIFSIFAFVAVLVMGDKRRS